SRPRGVSREPAHPTSVALRGSRRAAHGRPAGAVVRLRRASQRPDSVTTGSEPIEARFATPRMALGESGRMDLAWRGRSWHVRSWKATRNMRASLRAESRNEQETDPMKKLIAWVIVATACVGLASAGAAQMQWNDPAVVETLKQIERDMGQAM